MTDGLMLFLIFAAGALVVIAAIACLNAVLFPRLRPQPAAEPHPPTPASQGAETPLRVSILIPARDEAAVIGETVRLLLAQDSPAFEVVLLDDGSTDGTGEIARQAGGGDMRLRLIAGAPLPAGWLGKNWACHQLSQVARGELLVFTDADVRWETGALAALVAMQAEHAIDLLTVWPTQITVTWGERLVVPLLALVILGYLPIPLVNRTRIAAFAAANGQCLAFRRAVYDAVGGHAAVRGEIVEDIVFARQVKRAGRRLWMADGAGLIRCRMYRDWPGVRDGFAKNILAGYGGRVPLLLLGWAFHWVVFLLPPMLGVALLFGARLEGGFGAITLAGAASLTALGIGVRALTAAATRQRVGDALLLPVSVLLMGVIAAQALVWRTTGGTRWKGRRIGTSRAQ